MFRLIRNKNKAMSVYICFTVLFLMHKTRATSYYTTPALNRQFNNFQITNAIPENGKNTGAELQDPVSINRDISNGGAVIFEFKGTGNAQILFHRVTVEGPLNDVFLVEIGGDMGNDRVGIYDSSDIYSVNTNRLSSITVLDITSVDDYRYFWILWIADTTSIHVGTGHEIYGNEILSADTSDVTPRVYLDKISVMSISTTASNTGHWRFNTPAMVPARTSTTAHTPATATQRTRLLIVLSTTKTPTSSLTKLATASNTEKMPITSTRRKSILSTHIQPSVNAASQSIHSTPVEPNTSIYTNTKNVTVDVVNVSNMSHNSTTYSVLITDSMKIFSSPAVNDVARKGFLDKSENVVAVGVVASATGLSAIGVAGYMMQKKCSDSNTPSAL